MGVTKRRPSPKGLVVLRGESCRVVWRWWISAFSVDDESGVSEDEVCIVQSCDGRLDVRLMEEGATSVISLLRGWRRVGGEGGAIHGKDGGDTQPLFKAATHTKSILLPDNYLLYISSIFQCLHSVFLVKLLVSSMALASTEHWLPYTCTHEVVLLSHSEHFQVFQKGLYLQ